MDDTDFLRYVPKCYKCGEIIRPSGSPLDVAVARTNGREFLYHATCAPKLKAGCVTDFDQSGVQFDRCDVQ